MKKVDLYKITLKRNVFRYIPFDSYSCEVIVKNNEKVLEYFVFGKGYKTTRRFEVINVCIPETKDNIKDIVKYNSLYGKEVCLEYLITNNSTHWKNKIFNEAVMMGEHIGVELIEKCPDVLINLVEYDNDLLQIGICSFNIFKFDKRLEEIIAGYDSRDCTWNGKTTSMREVLIENFGEISEQMINKLNKMYKYKSY